MPRPRLRSGDNGVVDAPSAFLNIPYDEEFVDLYLAYIAGVAAFGIIPRTSLEIPGGERRLDRIFGLIQTCRYSFHDLGWRFRVWRADFLRTARSCAGTRARTDLT